jgi:hypothetical protein
MPERISRPERILWRPDEIEDFDEEVQSIIWIRTQIDYLRFLPSRCEREQRLLIKMEAALGSQDDKVIEQIRKDILMSTEVSILESEKEVLQSKLVDLNHIAATWKIRTEKIESKFNKLLLISIPTIFILIFTHTPRFLTSIGF